MTRKNKPIMIPIGRGKAKEEAPRFMYHTLRFKRALEKPPVGVRILAYEHRDFQFSTDKYRDAGSKFVYLSPTPLSECALKVDLSRLNPKDLRYTGQAEGYIIHKGNIPTHAIVKGPKKGCR